MKVLHVIDSEGFYGAEVVLVNLVQEQMKLGLEPVVCSIGETKIKEKQLEKEACRRNIQVKKVRMRPGLNLFGAFKLLRYAQAQRFDIIHCHGYKGNILFGLIPKPMRKIPIVSTLHGWTSRKRFSWMKLYEWLDVRCLKKIDAVVAVHEQMLTNENLQKRQLHNLWVVNNGMPNLTNSKKDETACSLSSSSAEGALDQGIIEFCKSGFIIGSIGRLSEEKGFTFLIEAFSQLRQTNENVKLLIIGEGGRRSYLEAQIAKLGVEKDVLLPGYKENAKEFFPNFNVFVLPSLTEGMPISLLEAMQGNVPIIATSVGGVPEILEKGGCGMLVEPGSSAELAKALSYIITHPTIANELKSKAHNIIEKKYSSEVMAKKYLNIYETVRNRIEH